MAVCLAYPLPFRKADVLLSSPDLADNISREFSRKVRAWKIESQSH